MGIFDIFRKRKDSQEINEGRRNFLKKGAEMGVGAAAVYATGIGFSTDVEAKDRRDIPIGFKKLHPKNKLRIAAELYYIKNQPVDAKDIITGTSGYRQGKERLPPHLVYSSSDTPAFTEPLFFILIQALNLKGFRLSIWGVKLLTNGKGEEGVRERNPAMAEFVMGLNKYVEKFAIETVNHKEKDIIGHLLNAIFIASESQKFPNGVQRGYQKSNEYQKSDTQKRYQLLEQALKKISKMKDIENNENGRRSRASIAAFSLALYVNTTFLFGNKSYGLYINKNFEMPFRKVNGGFARIKGHQYYLKGKRCIF